MYLTDPKCLHNRRDRPEFAEVRLAAMLADLGWNSHTGSMPRTLFDETLLQRMERLKAARAKLDAERAQLLKERSELLELQGDQLKALSEFNVRRLRAAGDHLDG